MESRLWTRERCVARPCPGGLANLLDHLLAENLNTGLAQMLTPWPEATKMAEMGIVWESVVCLFVGIKSKQPDGKGMRSWVADVQYIASSWAGHREVSDLSVFVRLLVL